MIRRYGAPRKIGRKYVARPGAYAILERGGEVLLTYQQAPHDEFQLPGGGIDPGETPLAALHREAFEETGWRISSPLRLGAFRRFVYMPEYRIEAEKICHVYLARPVRRICPPSEPDHVAVWATPGAAIRNVANEGDRAFLRYVFEGRFPV
jgi:8-oxo-dGTP diphosphatase